MDNNAFRIGEAAKLRVTLQFNSITENEQTELEPQSAEQSYRVLIEAIGILKSEIGKRIRSLASGCFLFDL